MNGEREREIRYTKPKSTGKEKWNEGWMKIMQTNNENSPKTKTGLNNGGRELASRARQWLRWDSAKKTVTAKKREFVSGKGKSGGCSEGVRCWFASTFVFFWFLIFFFFRFRIYDVRPVLWHVRNWMTNNNTMNGKKMANQTDTGSS